MSKLLFVVSLLAFASGCGDPEIIVTRAQFGEDWPLTLNSAVVVCADEGATPLLKVGVKRYALNEAARARGYPEATEFARDSADLTVLGSVCTAQVASNG
jgi:hypothetical protein